MSSSHSDSRYPPRGDWVPGQPPNPMRHAPPGPPLPPRPTDLMEGAPFSPDKPPPVPSTPRPSLMNIPCALQYPAKSEVFTLPELVEKHQNLFPLKVIVVKGHYGDRGEESAIATHEVYNIHFIKRSKVFAVKDNTGYEYIVPLNTACKFGLYYEKGTCYYDTVEDVMKASPLPQVIASQTAFYGGSPKSSVQRLEVLVIKGINKSRLNRKPTLTVFSITKKEEKQLSKDVLGRFTTDPSYTYMYLTDLVKFVPHKFPIDVHLYPEFDGDGPGATYLSSERMTITKEFVETCVVTSPLFEEEDGSNNYVELNEQVVDIPLTLPIEVSVLPPEENDVDDYEQLYEATKTLISGYDPHKTKTYRDTADDYSYTTQTQVFSAVRKGFENEGLNIEMPQAISTSRLPLTRQAHQGTPTQRPPTNPDKDVYEDMDAPNRYSSGSYEDFDPPPKSPVRSPAHQSLADKRLSGVQQAGKPPIGKGYQDFRAPLGYNTLNHSQSLDSNSPPHLRSNYDAPTLPPRRSTTNKALQLPAKEEVASTKASPLPPPVAPRRESRVGSSADGVFKRKEQPSPPSPKLLKIQKTLDSLSLKVNSLESAPIHDNTSELRQQLGSMESLVQSLQATCSSLSDMVDTLKTEVKDLKTQVKGVSCVESETSSSTTATSLRNLSCEQVAKLLEAMGPSLVRYKDAFLQEFIDGELLSQCTDDILENDLGIKNKLDRLKLMQVIRGTKSVESILQGSYVQFQFNGASKKT